jgi:Protein of unknown function (DUF3037)
VHDHCMYDYAVIRVVPRVEREEFVNVGVIVSCPFKDFLEARIELDEQRLMALDSTLDIDAIRPHLATIPVICAGGEQAGPIGQLSQRNRFHWLVAPRSTIIQTSPVHAGCCQNPIAVLEHLLDTMVRPPRLASPATEPGPLGTSEAEG